MVGNTVLSAGVSITATVEVDERKETGYIREAIATKTTYIQLLYKRHIHIHARCPAHSRGVETSHVAISHYPSLLLSNADEWTYKVV